MSDGDGVGGVGVFGRGGFGGGADEDQNPIKRCANVIVSINGVAEMVAVVVVAVEADAVFKAAGTARFSVEMRSRLPPRPNVRLYTRHVS